MCKNIYLDILIMAGFTESALVKKLLDLNPSQQSIQTLSLWLIHHRKHHPTIVKVWYKEMCKGNYLSIIFKKDIENLFTFDII